MLQPARELSRQSKLAAVLRVSGGNFLEMYDFFVFAYYASAIGRAFFPHASEFASLMSSLMTFGAGFLMRPLGAIFLGAYIDRHGRRAGLILILAVMSAGTLAMALVPGLPDHRPVGSRAYCGRAAAARLLGRRRARRVHLVNGGDRDGDRTGRPSVDDARQGRASQRRPRGRRWPVHAFRRSR
jgi:hypothetical protein